MKRKLYAITLLGISLLGSCSKEEIPLPLSKAPILNIQDSLAVVDAWKKADGENWNIKWDLNNIQTWGGVGVILDKEANEYRVVQLCMNVPAARFVRGYLSSSIGDLTELRRFQVTGNYITGKIPQSFQKLQKLEVCQIGHTGLTDTLPGYLFEFPNINILEIVANPGITGTLPKEILNLPPDIRILNLAENNLSGKIPAGIISQYRVQLQNNCFTEFPFEYCQPDAPVLNLRGNNISGIIPDSILNNKEALFKLKDMSYRQKTGFFFENCPNPWD